MDGSWQDWSRLYMYIYLPCRHRCSIERLNGPAASVTGGRKQAIGSRKRNGGSLRQQPRSLFNGVVWVWKEGDRSVMKKLRSVRDWWLAVKYGGRRARGWGLFDLDGVLVGCQG